MDNSRFEAVWDACCSFEIVTTGGGEGAVQGHIYITRCKRTPEIMRDAGHSHIALASGAIREHSVGEPSSSNAAFDKYKATRENSDCEV